MWNLICVSSFHNTLVILIFVALELEMFVSLLGSKHNMCKFSSQTFSIKLKGSNKLNDDPTSIKLIFVSPCSCKKFFSKIIDFFRYEILAPYL